MTLATSAATPWYREPWPWILMSGPAAVIVAGAFTIWIAFSGADGLVTQDYYKQGLAINRTLAQIFGLHAHFLDDLDFIFLLCQRGPFGDSAISADLPVVLHGALEAGPVDLLLRGQPEFSLDARRARTELIRNLVCREFSAVQSIASIE